jgi:large subunit ribosomal protein L17
MRHKVHTFKIGRTGAHRKAMLANMVSSLIEHGEIKTTLTKAKEARRFADKMVTLGKKGDLHRRRLAVSRLRDKTAVKKLFDEIAPQYTERDGGYTRIIKLGRRTGDAAEMCLLQFVENDDTVKKAAKPKKAKAPQEEPKVEEVKEVKAEEAETAEAEEAKAEAVEETAEAEEVKAEAVEEAETAEETEEEPKAEEVKAEAVEEAETAEETEEEPKAEEAK